MRDNKFKCDSPFKPWNRPMYRNNPFAPWNDPMKKNDPFACWNSVFGNGNYEDECNKY